MRIVLDTNVLVAAGFKPHSSAARLVEAVRRGHAIMIWDATTRAESQRIIERIPPLDWLHFADLFDPAHEHTRPLDLAAFTQVPDPDDRKFAALAAATGATLVSNDAHLLTIRDRLSVTIRTPVELAGALPDE